jgi:hypothetical protein
VLDAFVMPDRLPVARSGRETEALVLATGAPCPRTISSPFGRVDRRLVAVVGLVLATLTAVVPISLASFTDTAASSGSFAAATLAPPTSVSATGGSSVVLSWTASTSTGATGTIVERATALAGPYSQVGTVTPVSATSFSDNPANGTYWYRLGTYVGNWRSATTTPVSAVVTPTTSTGAKPCASGSNAADTGGNGNGYEGTPNNACAADGAVATDGNTGTAGRSTSCTNAANDRHRFWGYAFGLPGTVTSIDGITVRADAGMNNNGGTSALCVELSWDGGTTWSTARTVTLSGSAVATYTFGSTSDTWGHTWTAGQLSTTNFRVRVTDATNQPNKDYRLDYLAVMVQYTP